MPQGIEIYDAAGNLVLGMDDRAARFLGELTPGAAAGSHDIAGEAAGAAWFYVKGRSFALGGVPVRDITVAGSVISWTAHSSGGSGPTIVYGVR